jgi:thiol-disulfide isomerase/thioredoxin
MEKPTEAADGKMTAAPAWFGATLTDASTGNTFTINDFKGKVVLVETMAQWCPNCKQQQTQVKALHELLGMNNDLVSLGLDIDPNENLVDLKNYVTSNGFDWLYAVAPADVSREIGTLYGDNFLNPPSTPILVIDRKGESHPLPFGIKSADELKKFIEPFLQDGM